MFRRDNELQAIQVQKQVIVMQMSMISKGVVSYKLRSFRITAYYSSTETSSC